MSAAAASSGERPSEHRLDERIVRAEFLERFLQRVRRAAPARAAGNTGAGDEQLKLQGRQLRVVEAARAARYPACRLLGVRTKHEAAAARATIHEAVRTAGSCKDGAAPPARVALRSTPHRTASASSGFFANWSRSIFSSARFFCQNLLISQSVIFACVRLEGVFETEDVTARLARLLGATAGVLSQHAEPAAYDLHVDG